MNRQKKIAVLFTGGGGSGTEALWRLLASRYELHFADADSDAINPLIPFEHRHQIPWANSSEYFPELKKICCRLNIDVLIPAVDEELIVCATNIASLAPTKLMLPNADYVETMLDKLKMIQKLKHKHIDVPMTNLLKDGVKNIDFPCIVKPRKGRGSRDVRVINTVEDVIALQQALGESAENHIVQNKIEGTEYTVQMIADIHGQLSAIVPVRVDMKRGITIRAEVDNEPNVIASCKLIHKAFPCSGCYNIQLMLQPDGKVLPFEINPRISTTFCLVVAAEVDPIAIFLQKKRTDECLHPFVVGMQLRRYWVNHFTSNT